MKSVTTSTSGPHSDQKWRNNAACCDSYKFGQPICSTKTADARLWRNAIGDRSWTISRGVKSICTLCWKMHAAVCAWAISVRRWETNHQQPRWRTAQSSWMTPARERDSIAQKDARYGYNCFWLRETRAPLFFSSGGRSQPAGQVTQSGTRSTNTHKTRSAARGRGGGGHSALFFLTDRRGPTNATRFPKTARHSKSRVCMCGSE